MPDITVSMPSDPDQGTEARRFRLIFDQQRRAVLAYVLRRVDDPEDAADAVAETFLVAWRRLDDVPRGDGARPWLLGVARRVLANQRRGARRHTGLADRLGRELATQIPVVEDASETDLLVRRALEALTDDDREILLLAGWEGLSPAEIAAAVGLSGLAGRLRLDSRSREGAHPMTDTLDQVLRDAAPIDDEQVRALSLDALETELREAILLHGRREEPRRPAGRRRPLRWRLPGLAAAAVAAAAVLAVTLTGGGEKLGTSPERAWAKPALRVANAVPRLLIGRPGWTVTRADEFSVLEGEMTLRNGARRVDLFWRPGPLPHGRCSPRRSPIMR